MDKTELYRRLPKVDTLLKDEAIQAAIEECGRETVMEAIRAELENLRAYIASCKEGEMEEGAFSGAASRMAQNARLLSRPDMRMVMNGTGTILHTNLGRAPISQEHMRRVMGVMTGYSNLEYDLGGGKRGERYSHFEKLLCKLTGAEAAMAVNNNASSVFLILNSLAEGGEAIVSRGELVEIGGKFRIPDVMAQSGVSLVEAGTTNKTHWEDYERAITENTKALLKVHTSNYRIVGFTAAAEIDELASLGKKYGLAVIEDLGSGVLIDLSKYGLSHEPTVQESVAKGADVVCFSGDKLLGGPQAGIIVGKKKYIDKMKQNQLTRALRIDKFTAALLELVLREYLSEERAVKNIPTLRMITKPIEEAEAEAGKLLRMLSRAKLPAKFGKIACESQIGGGSLPLERIASAAVFIKPKLISVSELELRMRRLPVPIIPRVTKDMAVLDVRTLFEENFSLIKKELSELRVLEEQCLVGV